VRKLWIRSFGMAAALAFVGVSAHAGDALFSPLDIADAYNKGLSLDTAYNALVSDPSTGYLQLVNANVGTVSEKADTLTLNLEPGLTVQAHRVEAYRARSGSLVWVGVIADPGTAIVPFTAEGLRFDPINQVILVKDGRTLTGNAHFAGELYAIRPLKTRGAHALVHVDKKQSPPDHPEDYDNLPIVPMDDGKAATDKADTIIRVMVNYTPSAAAASGNISSLIDLAVAESNQGYTNSGVLIDLILANKSQVSYTESGSFSTDLSRYRSTTDTYMNSIHTTRNSVAADVAVLIINNSSACGLASGIGSTASTAFAAAHWSCVTGYYSFAHEIGHLQSARHDPATDSSTSPYPYGHGYRYTGSPSWRTIMAYNCPAGCPRLNYWSSPLRTYNGVPMGTSTQSDNVRVLNNTRNTVAAFR
jgi:hypothetical protein